jgi:hypothetical protein
MVVDLRFPYLLHPLAHHYILIALDHFSLTDGSDLLSGVRPLLFYKIVFVLELSPHKISCSLCFFLDNGPPPTFLEQLLDKLTIVAFTDVKYNRVSAIVLY